MADYRIVRSTKKSIFCENCGFPLYGFVSSVVSHPTSSGKRRYLCLWCSLFLGEVSPNEVRLPGFHIDTDAFNKFWNHDFFKNSYWGSLAPKKSS